MTAPKLIPVFGLLGDVETVYGDGGTLTAALDGILLTEPTPMTVAYAHGGERPIAVGTAGTLQRAAPSGRSGEFTPRVEARGAGAAYSATVLPPDIDTLMRISGHAQTLDVTASLETVTYDPESAPASYESGGFEAYTRGQLFTMASAYATLSFLIEGPSFMVFEATVMGTLSDPTDVALPVITYNTTLPPKAISLALAIGAITGTAVRRIAWTQNRNIAPRLDMNNADGHKGFSPGRRESTLEILVEAEAFATWDPYADWKAATVRNITFTIGSVQYNKVTFNAVQAQVANVTEEEDGPTALWGVTFNLGSSDGASNDEYQFVWD